MPFIPAIGVALGATVGTAGATWLGAAALGAGAFGASKLLKSFTPEQTQFQGSDAQLRNTQATQELQQAQTSASSDAARLIQKRRRAGTQTVFSNPLGVTDQATIARKTLLGE